MQLYIPDLKAAAKGENKMEHRAALNAVVGRAALVVHLLAAKNESKRGKWLKEEQENEKCRQKRASAAVVGCPPSPRHAP